MYVFIYMHIHNIQIIHIIYYILYIIYIPINRNKRHNDEKTHQQPTRLAGVLSLKARPEEFHPPETADPGVPPGDVRHVAIAWLVVDING